MAYAHSNRATGRKKQDSPLRVRKTRENLRQANDLPNNPAQPSLMSKLSSNNGVASTKKSRIEDQQSLDTASIENNIPLQVSAANVQHESSATPIVDRVAVGASTPSSGKIFMQPEIAKPIQRRKSVRKRVVSKMKEGILSRSRSTNKILDMVHSGPITEQSTFDHSGAAFVRHAEQFDRSAMNPTSGDHLLQGYGDTRTADMLSLSGRLDAVITTREDTPDSSQSRLKNGSSPTVSISPYSPSPEHTPRPARRPDYTSDGSATVAAVGTLQVRISTTSSVATLDIAESKSVWVMVKAEAVMPVITMAADNVACQHRPDSGAVLRTQCPVSFSLDVIVIIDNSSVSFQRTRNWADSA